MADRFNFRVWDNELKKMFYVVDEDESIEFGCNGSLIGVCKEDQWHGGLNCIVEQCAGLKDKNDKLIYEGDIIVKNDINELGYKRTRLCTVSWHDKWLSWVITTQYGDIYELSDYESDQYEIVGNIHENADLLIEND